MVLHQSMFSFTQNKTLSVLEELLEGEEKAKHRRRWFWLNYIRYSCCFLRNPYNREKSS